MNKTGWIIIAMFMSFSAKSACLDEVSKFAQEMCGELSKKGSSNVENGSGKLNVKAEGILLKFLGKAGVEGDVGEVKKTYENVLREDLGSELKNNRSCRLKMVEIATKQCSIATAGADVQYIKWPEGKKRYYIEAANIRASCEDDSTKSDHELKIIVENKKVKLELNSFPLRGRLVDEGKTILATGSIPIDGGYTSFSNAELRLKNDNTIEAEMEWIWRDDEAVCTGALLISNSIVQRWK